MIPAAPLTEEQARRLARSRGLILHKSKVRTPSHPECGRYWLMQSDDYHPHGNYQGHAHLTLADVGEVLSNEPVTP